MVLFSFFLKAQRYRDKIYISYELCFSKHSTILSFHLKPKYVTLKDNEKHDNDDQSDSHR